MSEPVKLRPHNQAHCKDCSLAPCACLFRLTWKTWMHWMKSSNAAAR